MAREKLDDAKALLDNNRWDAAYYICGYAVEFKMKSIICTTLNWRKYLYQDRFSTFKTHHLETLIILSGKDEFIRADRDLSHHWNKVSEWNSEMRYATTPYSRAQAEDMHNSATIIVNTL